MTQVIDREMLKDTLRQLIREEPKEFKAIVKEAFSDSEDEISEEFKQLLKQNFNRFEETFKALA